ncbi:hypothetical protein TELCIR_18876, partial [Teladorsagia circumcincta]
IAFFGDDTWLRLFPNAFVEAEGVTSFFVNDFTEVDNNVTRHLDSSLKSRDWDVLILHYLGLDHVDSSVLALSDVHGDERCRVAKTFASHARGRLAMEENRQAQRRIIESQEQTFRWPIFISLALLVVGFISLSGAYEDHMHGSLKSRTE